MTSVVSVRELRMSVDGGGADRALVEGVSFDIEAGEAVGLVGESGSGKSMTAQAVMRLQPPEVRAEGSILFEGREVLTLDDKELRDYRRHEVSMIFQDPRAAINPVRTIGQFLTEGLRRNDGVGKDEARERAVRALEAVGVDRAKHRLGQYPHQLSGGLLQRVMICSTLLTNTRLLLADEATTALDVTTQAEVVGLLDSIRRERAMGLLFITHDLDLAVALCDRVLVMYAGRIVESRSARDFVAQARHPYSRALFDSRPSLDTRAARLTAIAGAPAAAHDVHDQCGFAPRCPFVVDECRREVPALREVDHGTVRCLRAEELASTITPGQSA